jgi:hypothetical protein
MPLLNVTQTKHVSASIRLAETTATRIDQYVAFVRGQDDSEVEADQIIEEGVLYAFGQDRDFQKYLKTPGAQKVTPSLRIRKPAASDAAEPPARKAAIPPPSPLQTPTSVAGSRT